ncbi:MAG: alpha/beta fold hydrolase [Acidobacteriota bacterium]
MMKKIFIKLLISVTILIIVFIGVMFMFQEKQIFFPEKLDKSFQFDFDQKFEEIFIKTDDESDLHGILFPVENSKGMIFYLHGNAGSLRTWGNVAETYTDMGYDIFILDYRGYGKSGGEISSEKQLYSDVQTAYNELKKRYDEKEIIVLGYSIGSGPAAKIASDNNPKLLILQAPYYNLPNLMRRHYPLVPGFFLKYKFRTDLFIKNCKMPMVIFHGDKDEVIYYGSSLKLQKLFKPGDRLITLKGQMHNGITDNPEYKINLIKILEN